MKSDVGRRGGAQKGHGKQNKWENSSGRATSQTVRYRDNMDVRRVGSSPILQLYPTTPFVGNKENGSKTFRSNSLVYNIL